MSLSTKTLIILFIVICILFTSLEYGVLRKVVFPSFVSLERDEAKKNMERCIEFIDNEISHLDKVCDDWAGWDDTYEFVVEPHEEYIESNLVYTTFSDNDISLIYIINLKGEVIWGKVYNLDSEKQIQLKEFPEDFFPQDHPLLLHGTGRSHKDGIFITEIGLILVCSRSIHTSMNEGPSRGTMIMGRFIDKEIIKEIEDQNAVKLTIWEIDKQDSDSR